VADQWYLTEDGRRRLQAELTAIEAFNRPRPDELRLVGRRHKEGHLVIGFAFQPLLTRPDVVRGELVLSSRHPLIEPAARITTPTLQVAPHLLDGEGARAGVHDRTIPLDWARRGPLLCLFAHLTPDESSRWSPARTAVSVVLSAQGWYLNYLCFRTTGRWPLERVA
jgi:hypothetical protein